MQLGLSFDEPEPQRRPTPAAPEKPAAKARPVAPAEEPAAVEPRVLSVGELTRLVRATLEERVGEVWVRGEISNHRRQASGHQYFTLKDDSSQLACVLFARSAAGLRGLKLADGMQVQVFGELTVYDARGQYQLVVRLVQEEGLGALQAKFEALKAKLAAEGLFDTERKRPIPRMPRRIGVVTSPTGAAIRDFLKVLHRRMPSVEVVIHPVRVQGRGAAAGIAGAIADFSRAAQNGLPEVDVVVVTRGGGSLEDLWEFNEESVARAVAESRIPVVSAVGHEIDFTLSDFAADLRAPTPSAAAEILVPDRAEIRRFLAERVSRIARECATHLRFHRARLDATGRSALHHEPARVLREFRQRLDQLDSDATRAVLDALRARRDALAHGVAVLGARRPSVVLPLLAGRIAGCRARLDDLATTRLARMRDRWRAASGMLRTLSPDATLARGYSITTDGAGRVVRSVDDVAVGDRVTTRLRDGRLVTGIEEIC